MDRYGYTDRAVLTTEAYADPGRLTARISLYRYRRPRFDPPAFAVDLLHGVDGPVLDVGCGPGHYARALRADRPHRTVMAADLSYGMASVAGRPALVADVTALPVRDRSCGAALAMHMLYHAPDPEAGVRELARVVRPGGTVLISTNAEDDKAGLAALCVAAHREVPDAPEWNRDFSDRFGLRVAEAMARRHFDSVERLDVTGEIVLTDPEPVVAHAASTLTWQPGDPFSRVLDRLREKVAEVIATEGEFRFGTHVGFLLCR